MSAYEELIKSYPQFSGHVLGLIPYGSRIYLNHRPDSDYDYLLITNIPAEEELHSGDYSFQTISSSSFQNQLIDHDIRALEVWFTPWESGDKEVFSWNLNLVTLRKSISEKSSNSWVKAKKKIIQGDILIGQKSLYHSIRIILFGIQLAQNTQITNFQAANTYWKDINNSSSWDDLKEKFQPILNKIKSEFKLHCPKE